MNSLPTLALAAGLLADPSDPPLSRSEADLAALPHSNSRRRVDVMTTPPTTASSPPVRGGEDWVLVPRIATKAMLDAAYTAYDAYEAADTGGWGGLGSVYSAMIAAAPSPEARAGEIPDEAIQAALKAYHETHDTANVDDEPEDLDHAAMEAALYEADKVRSGHLLASTAGRDGEDQTGATPLGSGWSSSTEPKVSALTGDHPSRDAVDFEELDRLFALMPEGPWHPLRTGDSHEIRQIDTDPTNKHHWPFRLCQSIAGQRAACDDAVFAFIAGVLNAWPSISAVNSDDAFIERTLAMPEDELRKRFLIDGKCPEQAADIARQSFRIAALKVALTQISSQYIENRGDMTDAEALHAIGQIAARALVQES